MTSNHNSHYANIAERLERLPLSRLHYRLLTIHGFGWLFDAMDVGIVTFVMVALAKDWGLHANQLGLIGSAGLAGMIFGAAISGRVADKWGRKTVFQITLLIFSISTLLCAISWNVTSLVAFRFLVGVGLGGELPVVSSLLSEFIPFKHRGRFVVLLESFWAYGWLMAALIAFLVIPEFGWRIAFLVGSIPAFYIWVIRRKLPESPRWLAAKGNTYEAEKVVKEMEDEIEKINQTRLPRTHQEYVAIPDVSSKVSFSELWTRQYTKRTIMLWVLWFGLVFGYYGIFIWLPTLLVNAGYSMVNSFFYVIIITLAQIPGYFSAAYLLERLGRKPVIATYLLFSAIAAYLFGHASSTWTIVLWASLMSFFNLGAWGAVYAYTPELYPTRIRATGSGSAAAFGRVGGFLAPLIVGFLLPTVGTSGILVLNGALFVVSAVSVILLGEETKGRLLEDISN